MPAWRSSTWQCSAAPSMLSKIFKVFLDVPSFSYRISASLGGVMPSSLPCMTRNGQVTFCAIPSRVNFLMMSTALLKSRSGTPNTHGTWKCEVAIAPFFICSCERTSQACMSHHMAPSEAEILYEKLGTSKKTLKIFDNIEGAAEHCQVDDRQAGINYMADWLAENVFR